MYFSGRLNLTLFILKCNKMKFYNNIDYTVKSNIDIYLKIKKIISQTWLNKRIRRIKSPKVSRYLDFLPHHCRQMIEDSS